MAKKTAASEVQETKGGRRICPDCKLPFRLKELFDQHRSIGCKPEKSNGPTWSEKDPEGHETSEKDATV